MDGKQRATLRELCTRGGLGNGSVLIKDTELFDLLADSERAERYRKAMQTISEMQPIPLLDEYSNASKCHAMGYNRRLAEIQRIVTAALQEPTPCTCGTGFNPECEAHNER